MSLLVQPNPQGSVLLATHPVASEVQSDEILNRYQSILQQQQIGWTATRPFLRRLGVGGQGVVYLSVRQGADNFSLPVALKVFSPKRYDDAQSYEREMCRIAQVAARVARIQQDNLIDVQNVIKQDGIHMMEMEWVDGYDLRRLLTPDTLHQVRDHVTDGRWENINNVVITAGVDQPRLKPGLAIAVVRECLAGLAALHREGIVHSDVKPSNIMLKRTGNVKIIDIGSAFELQNQPPGQPGTPAYAAPEVLEGVTGSPQSDLASLGYVLLEMVSGSQPFAGMNYHDMVQAKRGLLHELPRLLPPEEFAYSEPLMILIRRLAHPEPSRRFPTAEAADLSDGGAASFHRELVKGDLAGEYENEIRLWIDEMQLTDDESDTRPHGQPGPSLPSTRNWSSKN